MDKEKNLVWIDLEMTGLNANRDVILEIASIITDSELNTVAEGPSIIIHQPDEALSGMDEWVSDQHGKTGLIDAVRSSTVSLEQAEQQTLDFIRTYCETGTSPLCGNSVGQDRLFMQNYMPRIFDFLHYRIIDVSTVKELVQRWYPESSYNEYKKKDTHRALADIRESVEELKHFRKHFFVS